MMLIQLPIAFLLFMVLAFGIGFILNMLVKTTWLPIVIYVGVISYLLYSLGKFAPMDMVVLSGGLVGAILSAVSIKLLRVKGFKMF